MSRKSSLASYVLSVLALLRQHWKQARQNQFVMHITSILIHVTRQTLVQITDDDYRGGEEKHYTRRPRMDVNLLATY